MSCLPLPEHGKFYDLNVPYENAAKALNKLSMLVELGYEVIAFSRFLPSSTAQNKGKKYEIPSPPEKIELAQNLSNQLKSLKRSLMQLSRLTIELKEINDLIKVRSAVTSDKYDIIAVCPMTDELFRQSCTELNIDVIALHCSTMLPFVPQLHLLTCARRRGIFIEVCYSPMIRDRVIRSNAIANSCQLSRVRKFQNLIFSSGCLSEMELRGPYDVANLGSLCGIPESIFLHTVSKHCRAVVVHGFLRKTAKGAIYVQHLEQSSQILPNSPPKSIEVENSNKTDCTLSNKGSHETKRIILNSDPEHSKPIKKKIKKKNQVKENKSKNENKENDKKLNKAADSCITIKKKKKLSKEGKVSKEKRKRKVSVVESTETSPVKKAKI